MLINLTHLYRNRCKLFFIIFLCLTYSPAHSQGTYYWNQNYGTFSNLLGGLVIGSVRNVSATYYNPGYLGLTTPELILGGKIFEYNDYNIKSNDLIRKELRANKFSASPGFFAGSFQLDTLKSNKFFYSYLVRDKSEYKFNSKDVTNNPDIESLQSKTNVFTSERDLTESWVGLSWGYSPKDQLGVGVTSYLAIRSDKFRLINNLSVLTEENKINSVIVDSYYNFYNVRFLGKIGVFWKLFPFSFGINLTTPSINFFGDGDTFVSLIRGDQAIHDSSASESVYVSDFQEDLNSTFKNSLHLGFGASYEFHKSRFHISVEWFNKVPQYNILTTQPFLAQSTGETLTNHHSASLRSVINYGIGYELYLSETVSGYGSFFVDHNANNYESRFKIFNVKMPIYHLTTGANIKIKSTDLTAGLEFAYGSHEFETSADLFSDAIISRLKGEFTYFRIKGIVSASFQL